MFSKSINPKRTGLQVLIVSVVISASLAIFSLLRGEFSETDGNILMTAFSVAAASVLTLSNGIVLEQGRNKPLATLAIIVSVAGFGILIVTIWNIPSIKKFGRVQLGARPDRRLGRSGCTAHPQGRAAVSRQIIHRRPNPWRRRRY